MVFTFSEKQQDLQARLEAFMDEHVYPNEGLYYEQLGGGATRWRLPTVSRTRNSARA